MKSSTGRWVSGEDFYDRKDELELLESRVRDGNHLVLTGQRRMGKTSVLRELGDRLTQEGWVFLFADIEGAKGEEDVIVSLAEEVHAIRPIARLVSPMRMRRWFLDRARSVKRISAHQFALDLRSELNPGTWRRHGERLIRLCAKHDKPVLIAIDELPIFLVRLLRNEDGIRRTDEFLSWLRAVFQTGDGQYPVLVVSGSIGLAPLVQGLGLSDRINYLDPIRLRPWSREISIECFNALAKSYGLSIDDGVANSVHEHLGVGIPQHVQSFFARLRDYATMRDLDRISVGDVAEVYRTELLGPSGQNDLAHYESRLRDGLDEGRYSLAMEILAEAATQGVFSADARRGLERRHRRVKSNAPRQIRETLDILIHDGYLELESDGHRFESKLLRDWWAARFRHHHRPLASQATDTRERDIP